MTGIHPSAVVDSKAEIASDVVIGPFCVVEAEVEIGSGTKLESHAVVLAGTKIGKRNVIGTGAVLGGDPQDRRYEGQRTSLEIGDDNVIREFVTIHRSAIEGESTTVGNDCYLMSYCHLGHNCVVEDHVTMANTCGISGHVTIEEYATIGGMTGVHQFVRIGRVSMIGGMSGITRDVPPFMLLEGRQHEVRDINAVGLRRIGIGQEGRMALHKACKLLYKSQFALTHAMETVRREVKLTPEVEYLLSFEERRFKGKMGRGDQR